MYTVKSHLRRYPKMEPTDVIKLLYQRAFGGGHLISDPAASLARLTAEYSQLPPFPPAVRTESVGGGMTRLYLDGIPAESLPTVNRLFVMGAAEHRGDPDGFQRDLDAVTAAAQAGEMPFSADVWRESLAAYRAAGCPMVSHSAAYREAYAPSYRILPEKFAALLPLLCAVDAHIAARGRVVLALDGMCGSGKTTLTGLLTRLYDAAVVRMDDFFLPPSLRTEDRLAQPGGNIHRERFAEEVMPHLGSGELFTYRAFDCGVMALGETVAVPARPLTVVEGSYALYPDLRGGYDLTAYLFCDPAEQSARLAARCSSQALLSRFEREWIPMENRYAAAFQLREEADYIIDTTRMDWRESSGGCTESK